MRMFYTTSNYTLVNTSRSSWQIFLHITAFKQPLTTIPLPPTKSEVSDTPKWSTLTNVPLIWNTLSFRVPRAMGSQKKIMAMFSAFTVHVGRIW
jgi:hypothetical protein